MSTEMITPTKYRVTRWFNKKKKSFFYGIDAKCGGEWAHCMDDSGMISFMEEKDAKAEVKRLNNLLKPTPQP